MKDEVARKKNMQDLDRATTSGLLTFIKSAGAAGRALKTHSTISGLFEFELLTSLKT
jgi:hypothetical protein